MTEAGATVSAVGVAVTTQVIAEQAGQALTDVQMIVVALAAGLMGGFCAMLTSKDEISLRGTLKRCFAAAMVAPGLVALALYWSKHVPTLFEAVAACLAAGAVAWPVWEKAQRWAPVLIGKRFGGDQ